MVCLGWVAWAYSDALLYQQWADAALGSPAAASADAPPGAFDAGAPVARVRIPRLDLSVVVAEGTSDGILRRAAGRLSVSAPPGSDGNVVVAAHRDSFFRPLEKIEIGDRVFLDRPHGSDAYDVEWMRIVEPTDVGVTEDTGYAALTLVTCYPFHFLGPAPKRFIVRARRVGRDAARTAQTAGGAPPPPWIGDAS